MWLYFVYFEDSRHFVLERYSLGSSLINYWLSKMESSSFNQWLTKESKKAPYFTSESAHQEQSELGFYFVFKCIHWRLSNFVLALKKFSVALLNCDILNFMFMLSICLFLVFSLFCFVLFCFLPLTHDAVSWSVVCACGISWSYSLTICVFLSFVLRFCLYHCNRNLYV